MWSHCLETLLSSMVRDEKTMKNVNPERILSVTHPSISSVLTVLRVRWIARERDVYHAQCRDLPRPLEDINRHRIAAHKRTVRLQRAHIISSASTIPNDSRQTLENATHLDARPPRKQHDPFLMLDRRAPRGAHRARPLLRRLLDRARKLVDEFLERILVLSREERERRDLEHGRLDRAPRLERRECDVERGEAREVEDRADLGHERRVRDRVVDEVVVVRERLPGCVSGGEG